MTHDTSTQLHPTVEECLQKCGILFQVLPCDPALADTAAFCSHYGYAENQTANCIIAAGKTDPVKYACCVVLAACKLDVNKTVCRLLGVKKASFASADQTLELTGMQIGGVTPFGLPDIPIYIDAAVINNAEIVLGGGNRSSKVLLNPRELAKLPNVQIVEGLAVAR